MGDHGGDFLTATVTVIRSLSATARVQARCMQGFMQQHFQTRLSIHRSGERYMNVSPDPMRFNMPFGVH